jgi:hypothetical protein
MAELHSNIYFKHSDKNIHQFNNVETGSLISEIQLTVEVDKYIE